MRAVKVQASLCIRAVSPEPPLLAHTSSQSRGTFRQKARSLAPPNGWACAVKICNDGMLEDTNSLDTSQLKIAFSSESRSPTIKTWSLRFWDFLKAKLVLHFDTVSVDPLRSYKQWDFFGMMGGDGRVVWGYDPSGLFWAGGTKAIDLRETDNQQAQNSFVIHGLISSGAQTKRSRDKKVPFTTKTCSQDIAKFLTYHKNWYTWKFCCNHPKSWTMWLFPLMLLKDVDGSANQRTLIRLLTVA